MVPEDSIIADGGVVLLWADRNLRMRHVHHLHFVMERRVLATAFAHAIAPALAPPELVGRNSSPSREGAHPLRKPKRNQ